jgi:hypothetical protein
MNCALMSEGTHHTRSKEQSRQKNTAIGDATKTEAITARRTGQVIGIAGNSQRVKNGIESA